MSGSIMLAAYICAFTKKMFNDFSRDKNPTIAHYGTLGLLGNFERKTVVTNRPHVTDPVTGDIDHQQTKMFEEGFKRYIRARSAELHNSGQSRADLQAEIQAMQDASTNLAGRGTLSGLLNSTAKAAREKNLRVIRNSGQNPRDFTAPPIYQQSGTAPFNYLTSP